MFTKLQYNDETVIELNSIYQIRRALVENIINEDICSLGCEIWSIQKKLNVSVYWIVDLIKNFLQFSLQANVRRDNKHLKLSIDSITDLPVPVSLWIYDDNQFGSNLPFQCAIRIVDRFIHHPITQKLFIPFSISTPIYENQVSLNLFLINRIRAKLRYFHSFQLRTEYL